MLRWFRKLIGRQTLVEKLTEACASVEGVSKSGTNDQDGYDYVKAADVAEAIRYELFNRGIIIIQDEESVAWNQFNSIDGGVLRECTLKVKFIVTDGREKLIGSGFGVGLDNGDKAIYKAKTGATKYFLRGLGLIPDRNDPEAQSVQIPTQPTVEATEVHKPPRTVTSVDDAKPIGKDQKNAFIGAAKKSGKTNEQINSFYQSLGISELDQMPKSKYKTALSWAMEAA